MRTFPPNPLLTTKATLLSEAGEPQLLCCSKMRIRQCYFSSANARAHSRGQWGSALSGGEMSERFMVLKVINASPHCNKTQNQKRTETGKIYRRHSNTEISTSEIDPTHRTSYRLRGNTCGEIPPVNSSNRKNNYSFQGRGIFMHCAENCQLTLTLIPLLNKNLLGWYILNLRS